MPEDLEEQQEREGIEEVEGEENQAAG